jgi:hypothetical protein
LRSSTTVATKLRVSELSAALLARYRSFPPDLFSATEPISEDMNAMVPPSITFGSRRRATRSGANALVVNNEPSSSAVTASTD